MGPFVVFVFDWLLWHVAGRISFMEMWVWLSGYGCAVGLIDQSLTGGWAEGGVFPM